MLSLAIRSPSIFPDAFFESNWTCWAVLFVVTFALLYRASSRAQKQFATMGYILLGFLLLWVVCAFLFDTPAERLSATHYALAKAAELQNLPAITARLDNGFRCPALGILSATDLTPSLAPLLKSAGITSVTVTHLQVTCTPPDATSHLTVFTQTTSSGTFKSTWDLQWHDDPASDWKLTRADLRTINDQPIRPDEVNAKLSP